MRVPFCITSESRGRSLIAQIVSVDLDIEGGGSTGYAAFITRLRSYFASANKQYVWNVRRLTTYR